MTYRTLIVTAKKMIEKDPPDIHGIVSVHVFEMGARWMFDQLYDQTNPVKTFNESIHFTAYALLKYGLSLIAMIASGCLFAQWHLAVLPLSILVFYVVEAHFVFLFPLLLDGVEKPVRSSITQTYRIGLFKIIFTVLPIGLYMVAGLFRLNDPLRNWYIGCLAIINWYKHDVRNRL